MISHIQSNFLHDRNFSEYKFIIPFLSCSAYGSWDSIEHSFIRQHSVNLCETQLLPESAARIAVSKYFQKTISEYPHEIDNGIFSVDQQAPNYFHFLAFVLPDLIGITKQLGSKAAINTLVLSDTPNFAIEYLRILGFNNQIAKIRNNPVIIKKAIGGNCYYQHSNHDYYDALLYVRSAILNKIGNSLLDSSYPKKVYIERLTSKNGSHHRKVYPQEILQQDLASHGWEVIYLETLPVIEQLRIFYNLDIVMGVHGAGLTNMIAMQESARVVEISHTTGCNPCFQVLAGRQGIDYNNIPIKSTLDLHPALPDFYINTLCVSPQSLPLEYCEAIREIVKK